MLDRFLNHFLILILPSLLPPEREESAISTIVIRGATDNIMDDVERAIDDGVNTFKALTKDTRMVPGAGATEIELAKSLTSYADVSVNKDIVEFIEWLFKGSNVLCL